MRAVHGGLGRLRDSALAAAARVVALAAALAAATAATLAGATSQGVAGLHHPLRARSLRRVRRQRRADTGMLHQRRSRTRLPRFAELPGIVAGWVEGKLGIARVRGTGDP